MEARTDATKNKAESAPTFSNSIRHLVYLHCFFGLNIQSKANYNVICNLFFGIHLVFGIAYLTLGILKAEVGSDDIQVMVSSMTLLFMGLQGLILKVSYRRSLHNVTLIIDRLDAMLSRFKGDERQLLKKIEIMSRCMFLCPLSVIVFYYIHMGTRYVYRTHVEYGGQLFRELDQKYHIDILYIIAAGPYNMVYNQIGLYTILPTCTALIFILNRIYNLPHTDIHKYLSIHREVCELYRLANKAFRVYLLLWCNFALIMILHNGRTVVVDSKHISWTTVFTFFSVFTFLCVSFSFISKVNNEIKTSQRHLLQMGFQMQNETEINVDTTYAHLPPVLDLYVTYVSIDDPCLTLGGMMKIRSQLIVAISSFVLCYLCVLYEK